VSGLVAVCLLALAFALVVPDRPDRVLARRVRMDRSVESSLGGWAGVAYRRATNAATRAKDAWIARRRADHRRAAVREACDVVVAELRAGHSPARALEAAADVLPDLAHVVVTSQRGGDVPTAMRAVQRAGDETLDRLAVAWAVASTSGAGLAGVLERVAGGLRDEEVLRREVAAQLSAPRASARVLAALPILGLALGTGAGADPIGFLLGSVYGWLCLVAAVALATVGLVWVERLARAAERAP
jgi:tight adherence protein B